MSANSGRSLRTVSWGFALGIIFGYLSSYVNHGDRWTSFSLLTRLLARVLVGVVSNPTFADNNVWATAALYMVIHGLILGTLFAAASLFGQRKKVAILIYAAISILYLILLFVGPVVSQLDI